MNRFLRISNILLICFALCSCNSTADNNYNDFEQTGNVRTTIQAISDAQPSVISEKENKDFADNVKTTFESTVKNYDPDITGMDCDLRYKEGLTAILEIIETTGMPGFLYDFDLDGIPEIALKFWGVNLDYYYEIYDCQSGILMGTISLGAYEEDWLVSPQLTLYYDRNNDKYFYIADRDFWDKACYFAILESYEFADDIITSSVIAQCEFEYSLDSGYLEFTANELLGNENTPIGVWNLDDIICYYDGLDEYLAQYEKISEVNETMLWDYNQAFTGEYEEIILTELEKYLNG